MVWFKADLRVDDHPGLIEAAKSASSLLAVYCLDVEQIAHLAFTPAGPEVLVGVLHELRAVLRSLGSELVVVQGKWDTVLPALAQKAGCSSVWIQEEVEQQLIDGVEGVEGGLSAAGVAVHRWHAGIWPAQAFQHSARAWRSSRPGPHKPSPAPTQLPPPPAGIEAGEIPDAEELRQLLEQHHAQRLMKACPGVASEAERVLAAAHQGPDAALQRQLIAEGRDWLTRLAAYLSIKPDSSGSSSSSSGSAGSSNGSGKLQSFMQQSRAKLERPGAEGYSFPAIFGTALALGALSRRRVYEQASSASSSSGGSGILGGAGAASTPPQAAALGCESADFHWQLAQRNDRRPTASVVASTRASGDAGPTVKQCHWRWRGFLTDYCVAEPAPGTEVKDAPAFLLLHGFGAMGDHFRDNMAPLAAAGFRVYAPTLPGFGRSEKASVPYSQVLWSDFLRDFCLQVAGGPVVLAGNSIGGFIATSMAADHPGVVRGLVLLNAAGPIQPSGFSQELWEKQAAARKPPPRWLVQGISGALFWYLERTVPGTLKWVYPRAPQRTEGWLTEEIERASTDIGAVAVFASVFYLPPPRPLNWLINERYKGPVMVLQGALDPLNDAKGRAEELGRLCPQHVTVKLLQAGHCPHDELPEEANAALLEFMKRLLQNNSAPAAQQRATSAAVA